MKHGVCTFKCDSVHMT